MLFKLIHLLHVLKPIFEPMKYVDFKLYVPKNSMCYKFEKHLTTSPFKSKTF